MNKRENNNIFLADLGWPFHQINGQRNLGPVKEISTIECGTEVIIQHLPAYFLEVDLFPICARFGHIYSMRILVNFTGETRGVAFVKYFDSDSANMAIQSLNRYKITSRNTLLVKKSIDNVKLYVGGIPEKLTEEELLQSLRKEVGGVVSVNFGPTRAANLSKGTKYAFAKFKSHRDASIARRHFLQTMSMMRERVKVDWAKPQIYLNSDSDYDKKNKRIFVRNLSTSISVANILRTVVLTMTPSTNIERIYIKNGYGFIHLTSHKEAESLLNNLKGVVIGRLPIHVEWARAAPSSTEEVLLSSYKSVPYSMIRERRRRRNQADSADRQLKI